MCHSSYSSNSALSSVQIAFHPWRRRSETPLSPCVRAHAYRLVFTSKLVPARFTKLLRRDLNLLQPIAAQEVSLARLAAAHCASRCSTASAAAFSAAVLWRHLVLAMACTRPKNEFFTFPIR